MRTRVLIADDHALVRAGFRLILDGCDDIDVVAEAATGRQAVAAASRLRPDVALLDIRMPDMDGLTATRHILSGNTAVDTATPPTPCRVIMLTTFDLDEYVYAALEAGASGFLLKDVTPERLLAAVRSVTAGDALLAPQITRRLVQRFARRGHTPTADNSPLDTLTPREREVLIQIARGLSNAEIANALYLSEATVKTHVSRILPKLGLRDRVQAVVLAYETGLVGPYRND